MKKAIIAAAALAASASQAFAVALPSGLQRAPQPVPEISALEGTAAVAAIAAIMLIAWERRRRAA